MSQIEIADLISSYPSMDDPLFQQKITSKYEFLELASSPVEERPTLGEYYSHQKLIDRFLRVYDECMLMHETGTGKTCSMVAAAEWARKAKLAGETNIRRVVFLVSNDLLKSNLKREIACFCTAGTYLKSGAGKKATQRKADVTREIKKWYEIKTFRKFAIDIAKKFPTREDDDRIATAYADTLFFMDEPQMIRGGKPIEDPEEARRAQELRAERRARKQRERLDVFIEGEVVGEIEEKEEDPVKRKIARTMDDKATYNEIWRVFHLAKRSKRVVSTATPMVNKTSELTAIANLILPRDRQIPWDFDYDTATLDDLAYYFNGRVSYVRSLDTGIDVENMGEIIQPPQEDFESKVPLYISYMKKFQEKAYLETRKEKSDDLLLLQREASNFVYPDGSFAMNGFKKYTEKDGYWYKPTDEFLEYLEDERNIKKSSCKYYEIVKRCIEAKGNCFVYGESKLGSGVVVLSMCFEAQGFERFNEDTSVFEIENDVRGYCATGREKEQAKKIKRGFEKKDRYAVLTPEVPKPVQDAMIECFNSYENRHGDYIKIILVSQFGRVGISLNNVVQGHLFAPEWTASVMYQALSRFIRATSHIALIRERQEQGISERLQVEVFRHAAVSKTLEDKGELSTDVHIYLNSERKDREIKRIVRMLKQIAFDCQIHYQRNVRLEDEDYSETCDYDLCEYGCMNRPPDEIDFSSYDILYSDEIVRRTEERVLALYKNKESYRLDELYALLNDVRPKFVDFTLLKLIDEKRALRDRFGYTSYLREDNGIFFLERSYPTQKKFDNISSFYTQILTALEARPLDSLAKEVQKQESKEDISKIKKLNPNSPTFIQEIRDLNFVAKQSVLEYAIQEHALGRDTPFTNKILEIFKYLVYELREPVALINQLIKRMGTKEKVGPGRKRTKEGYDVKRIKKDVEIEENPENEIVYLHTLDSVKKQRTKYNIISRFEKAQGEYRILKLSDPGGWRNATEIEKIAYNPILQTIIRQRQRENLSESGRYVGNIINGEFRIAPREGEKDDLREKKRSGECATNKKRDLVKFLWDLQVDIPKEDYDNYDLNEITNKTRKTYQDIIRKKSKISDEELRQWPLERIVYYYYWLSAKYSRDSLCEIIKDKLKELNLLLTIS